MAWCPPGGSSSLGSCNSTSGVTGMALVITLYNTTASYYETVAFRDASAVPKDDFFHHLAVVFTPTEIRTYRNGTLVAHARSGAAGPAVTKILRSQLRIGRSWWTAPGSPSDVFYSGFRVHSSALTEGQVAEAFQGVQPAAPVELYYKLDSCGSTSESLLSGKNVPDSSGRGRSGKLIGDIAMACPPPSTGIRFGTAGGATAQRYLDMSSFFASRTLVYPLSFESWIYPNSMPRNSSRWIDITQPTPMTGADPQDSTVNRTVPSSSGEIPAAVLVGDVNVTVPCPEPAAPPANLTGPPAPLIVSAMSTGPMTVVLTANFTAGIEIETLDAACMAPSAPPGGYAGSASVSDADAAGAAVSVSVELSYGGSYVVSCSVKALGRAGEASPSSAAVTVTVPAGNSIAAQNALMPSGDTGASNAFSRVGNPVESQESVQIVFAAPLANYLVGQRAASHRLGFITRTTSEFSFCDFDLDSNRCSFVQKLDDLLGDAEPTDFAYSSMTPQPHGVPGATNCLDFYDAEPSGRTFEGNETASDVRRAYPDLASFDALLLQELRFFQFWQRGVAFFSSFAVLRSSGEPTVVPLLKICSLPVGVALLRFDLSSIAPEGFTASAESVYKSVPWPYENGAFFADSFPVGASVQAMHTDGRVADGGPILYHAIVRIPFFPNATVAGACPAPLVSGICGARAVTHVIAMFTWEVDPSRFVDAPVGVRSFDPLFPAPPTYRTAIFTHTAPRVQNERPLHAGFGHGYLEGRWVDPPNSKYSFWVTGDRVIRVLKANAFQSGMASPAASIEGSVQIYKTADWRGTRQEWTSQRETFRRSVVQEVHTQANTRVFTFASDRETRPRYVHSRRMKRAAERAPGSRLIRLENVDDSAAFSDVSVRVTVLVPNFPANVLYATVVDDYSSGRMFESDPSIPFSELPWAIFVVSDPAYVIKLHSHCPPGTRWNWEAAVFNRSVAIADLCVDLPAGRYSSREGLLLDEDAQFCPSGTYSGAGATECAICEAGTYSDIGASACYDCPQHTFSMNAGDPCLPCEDNLFTPSAKWTFQCVPCFPGTYLEKTPLANCEAW
eukprot:tig00000241_g21038.t1